MEAKDLRRTTQILFRAVPIGLPLWQTLFSYDWMAGHPHCACSVAKKKQKNSLTEVSCCISRNRTVGKQMNFDCVINTGSSTPIYKQVTDQVRRAVATGRLAVGDQLPSVRVFAETLVLNPNTVARAYADLAREGLIESRPGRGVFLIHKRKVFTREEGCRRLEPLLEALIGEAMALDFSPADLQAALARKLSQWLSENGGRKNNE
jgi:GntR family transcriptional regulator